MFPFFVVEDILPNPRIRCRVVILGPVPVLLG